MTGNQWVGVAAMILATVVASAAVVVSVQKP